MDEQVVKMWDNELRAYLKNNSADKIRLFFTFLEMPKKGSQQENITSEKIAKAMEDYSRGILSIPSLLEELVQQEQYLSMLCHHVDPKKYQEIYPAENRFKEHFKELIIWADDYPRNGESLGFGKMERAEDCLRHGTPKQYWALAYWTRNQKAHQNIAVTISWKIQIVYAILYTMIVTTWKYRDVIQKKNSQQEIASQFDKKSYLKKIVDEYENQKLQKSFIKMNIVVYDTKMGEQDRENREDVISVMELMKSFDNSCRYMKLIGEAGMGKSRLMRHLEYLEAWENKVIPVYIELKNLIDVDNSIDQLIAERMDVPMDVAKKILMSQEVHLFLDGVNEILCEDREKNHICKKLDSLVDVYPKIRILISDRENSSITVSNQIPAFLLCHMDEIMQDQFIELNTKEEYRQRVQEVVAKNPVLRKTLSTPIILILLIQMIENGDYHEDVNSDKAIFACYVKGLIEREVREKGESRAKKIEYLLSGLAISDAPTNGEMSYYSEAKVFREFKRCADLYGIMVDMVEMLELVVQMGLLRSVQNGEYYTFDNKMLEEYFFEYAVEKGMIDYE